MRGSKNWEKVKHEMGTDTVLCGRACFRETLHNRAVVLQRKRTNRPEHRRWFAFADDFHGDPTQEGLGMTDSQTIYVLLAKVARSFASAMSCC